MLQNNLWWLVPLLGYLLTLVLVRWVLLYKDRNPASTVAWLLLIVGLPIIGGVLFLLFGIRNVDRRTELLAAARDHVSRHIPELSQYHLFTPELDGKQQQNLMRLATNLTGNIATYGNRIELLSDTNRTFGLIEQAVLKAQKFIHLEYYIWRADKAGTKLRDLLVERAKEGVQVRLIFDKFGSMKLSEGFLKPMREAGIEVRAFLPGASLRERWSINLRNHRKIVVVDGTVGFTGGMNIGDEYLGRSRELGYWRDTHLRVTGPSVAQLEQIFVEDWYFATGELLTQNAYFPAPQQTGDTVAQVIPGGPDQEFETFHHLMFTAITEAEHRLMLATSFFVPTEAFRMALEAAALRGVAVRLLVSGKSMHPTTRLAARSYYDSLMAAGVEIYEYTEGLLHSKTLTIDGIYSLVGSPNFDARSVQLNFEVAVAVYDKKFAVQLESDFVRDCERAKQVKLTEWRERSNVKRLAENWCRLFAPVM